MGPNLTFPNLKALWQLIFRSWPRIKKRLETGYYTTTTSVDSMQRASGMYTWPNISYTIQKLYLFMHDPVNNILNFLDKCFYTPCVFGPSHLIIFLIPTHNLFRCELRLSWFMVLQQQVTISHLSIKVEYHGEANFVVENSWLHNLLLELHIPTKHAMLVYCDNIYDIYLCCNLVHHQCTKHVELKTHIVREDVAFAKFMFFMSFPSSNNMLISLRRACHDTCLHDVETI